MEAITNAEVLIDSILCLTARWLYRAGHNSIMQLKQGGHSAGEHPNVGLWPSAFSAMQVIVNRKTPAHRDAGAAPCAYDLLLSARTHTQSSINLIDTQTSFSYTPGIVVLVCGRVILHEVPSLEGGEHICIAHYIRDVVHDRLGLEQSDWVRDVEYSIHMSAGYRARQGLA